jgi:hypothetical protein
MSSIVSPARKSSKAPVVPTSKAPAEVQAPAVVSLANATAEVQALAIVEALKAPNLKTAVGALADSAGAFDVASTLVSDKVLPTLHIIRRIVPILRNSAPSALFTDGNNRGARVGELFASRLGLGAQYRDVSRSNLKDARGALIESAK